MTNKKFCVVGDKRANDFGYDPIIGQKVQVLSKDDNYTTVRVDKWGHWYIANEDAIYSADNNKDNLPFMNRDDEI